MKEEDETGGAGVSTRLLVAIVVIVIVVAGAIAGVYFLVQEKANLPNGSVEAASASAELAQLGASSYIIHVTKVSVNPGGQLSDYILNVQVQYLGSASWQVDPSDFQVVSDTSAKYGLSTSDSVSGVTSPLPGLVLVNSQQAAGQLVFTLPADQTPSRLEYFDPSQDVNASAHEMPQELAYVCHDPGEQVTYSDGYGNGQPAMFEGDGGYYLSGNQIVVAVPLNSSGLAGPQSEQQITEVITNSSGATVTRVSPPLPAAFSQVASLSVTLSTPSNMCIGMADLQVTVSQAATTAVGSGSVGNATISTSSETRTISVPEAT